MNLLGTRRVATKGERSVWTSFCTDWMTQFRNPTPTDTAFHPTTRSTNISTRDSINERKLIHFLPMHEQRNQKHANLDCFHRRGDSLSPWGLHLDEFLPRFRVQVDSNWLLFRPIGWKTAVFRCNLKGETVLSFVQMFACSKDAEKGCDYGVDFAAFPVDVLRIYKVQKKKNSVRNCSFSNSLPVDNSCSINQVLWGPAPLASNTAKAGQYHPSFPRSLPRPNPRRKSRCMFLATKVWSLEKVQYLVSLGCIVS